MKLLSDRVFGMVWVFDPLDSRRDDVRKLAADVAVLETAAEGFKSQVEKLQKELAEIKRNGKKEPKCPFKRC